MAEKNASSPLNRRKMLVVNKEEVDNTFLESPRESPKRTSALALAWAIVPTGDLDESYEEEDKGDSESESESLSSKLGPIATKPSMKVTTTSMTKDSIQTESVPGPTEQQEATITTKWKKPIFAIESKKNK